MNNLEKIEQWANDNDYEMYCENKYILEKIFFCEKRNATIVMKIIYDDEKDFFKHKIAIDGCGDFGESNEIEELFIPFNNVKRDEKLLKEYLENEENND